MRLLVLSGTNQPRLRSEVNHAAYANRHGYRYHFDRSTHPNLPTVHFHKIRAIQAAFEREEFDWLFWLDDDAFITDPDRPLEGWLADVPPEVFLIACRSPVNLQGGWTWVSSGQFFLRRGEASRRLLDDVFATDLATVKAWWQPERFGLFTHGDQDAFVYQIHQQGLHAGIRLLDHTEFNCRPYHYRDGAGAGQHFLIHFPGIPDKPAAVRDFASRFALDPLTLVEEGLDDVC